MAMFDALFRDTFLLELFMGNDFCLKKHHFLRATVFLFVIYGENKMFFRSIILNDKFKKLI